MMDSLRWAAQRFLGGLLSASSSAASSSFTPNVSYEDLKRRLLECCSAKCVGQYRSGLNSFLGSDVAVKNGIVDVVDFSKKSAMDKNKVLINVDKLQQFIRTDQASKKNQTEEGLKTHNQVVFGTLRTCEQYILFGRGDARQAQRAGVKSKRCESSYSGENGLETHQDDVETRPSQKRSRGVAESFVDRATIGQQSSSDEDDNSIADTELDTDLGDVDINCDDDGDVNLENYPFENLVDEHAFEHIHSEARRRQSAPAVAPVRGEDEECGGDYNIVGVENANIFAYLAASSKDGIFLACPETMAKCIHAKTILDNLSEPGFSPVDPAIMVVDEVHNQMSRLKHTISSSITDGIGICYTVPPLALNARLLPLPKELDKVHHEDFRTFLKFLFEQFITDGKVSTILDMINSLLEDFKAGRFQKYKEGLPVDTKNQKCIIKFIIGADFDNYVKMVLMDYLLRQATNDHRPVLLDYEALKNVCSPAEAQTIDTIAENVEKIRKSGDKNEILLHNLADNAAKANKALNLLEWASPCCESIELMKEKVPGKKPRPIQRALLEVSSQCYKNEERKPRSVLVKMPPGMGKTLCGATDALVKSGGKKIYVSAPQNNQITNFALAMAELTAGTGRKIYMLSQNALVVKKDLEKMEEKKMNDEKLNQDKKYKRKIVNFSRVNKVGNEMIDGLKKVCKVPGELPFKWSYIFLSATPEHFTAYHRLIYGVKVIEADPSFLAETGSILYPQFHFIYSKKNADEYVFNAILKAMNDARRERNTKKCEKESKRSTKKRSKKKDRKLNIDGHDVHREKTELSNVEKSRINTLAQFIAVCLITTDMSTRDESIAPMQLAWNFEPSNLYGELEKIAAQIMCNTPNGQSFLKKVLGDKHEHLITGAPFMYATSTLENGKTDSKEIDTYVDVCRSHGDSWGVTFGVRYGLSKDETKGKRKGKNLVAAATPQSDDAHSPQPDAHRKPVAAKKMIEAFGEENINEKQIYLCMVFCSILLSTGVDCTPLKCIFMNRLANSMLTMQMIGRAIRLALGHKLAHVYIALNQCHPDDQTCNLSKNEMAVREKEWKRTVKQETIYKSVAKAFSGKTSHKLLLNKPSAYIRSTHSLAGNYPWLKKLSPSILAARKRTAAAKAANKASSSSSNGFVIFLQTSENLDLDSAQHISGVFFQLKSCEKLSDDTEDACLRCLERSDVTTEQRECIKVYLKFLDYVQQQRGTKRKATDHFESNAEPSSGTDVHHQHRAKRKATDYVESTTASSSSAVSSCENLTTAVELVGKMEKRIQKRNHLANRTKTKYLKAWQSLFVPGNFNDYKIAKMIGGQVFVDLDALDTLAHKYKTDLQDEEEVEKKKHDRDLRALFRSDDYDEFRSSLIPSRRQISEPRFVI